MIDRVEGRIVELDPTHVVLEVSGIGLFLSISLQTYEAIGTKKTFSLFTYLHVREDILALYGFAEKAERETFKQLISISGVGPRVGQAILSALTVSTLRDAVRVGDWKRLTAAPGVGRKLAERMTVELRDKVGESGDTDDRGVEGYAGPAGAFHEAVQALTALGHTPVNAEKLATRALKQTGEDATVEEIIRLALKG